MIQCRDSRILLCSSEERFLLTWLDSNCKLCSQWEATKLSAQSIQLLAAGILLSLLGLSSTQWSAKDFGILYIKILEFTLSAATSLPRFSPIFLAILPAPNSVLWNLKAIKLWLSAAQAVWIGACPQAKNPNHLYLTHYSSSFKDRLMQFLPVFGSSLVPSNTCF